jgi:hypothetical protein
MSPAAAAAGPARGGRSGRAFNRRASQCARPHARSVRGRLAQGAGACHTRARTPCTPAGQTAGARPPAAAARPQTWPTALCPAVAAPPPSQPAQHTLAGTAHQPPAINAAVRACTPHADGPPTHTQAHQQRHRCAGGWLGHVQGLVWLRQLRQLVGGHVDLQGRELRGRRKRKAAVVAARLRHAPAGRGRRCGERRPHRAHGWCRHAGGHGP